MRKMLSWVALIAVIAFSLMFVLQMKFASIKYHLLGAAMLLTIIVCFILITGPTKVFYAGHELIFPSNHQWFFYYEDSLMSTMMKAPALFGPIACQLLVIAIALWLLLLVGARAIKFTK